MRSISTIDSNQWLKNAKWFFVGGAVIAGVLALAAEGPGQFIGFGILCICVGATCAWSLTGKPSLLYTVAIISAALISLGWTVGEPESALFQSILITAAVGWRVERLSVSILFLVVLTLLPWVGSLGPTEADWGWWNWSIGTAFTWCLGRVIRLLEQTLNELTYARSQLVDGAAREERLRISRDVHDLVGHSLTAMLLNIRAAQRTIDSDIPETKKALTDAERVGTTGLAEIRSALVDLREVGGDGELSDDTLSSLPTGESVQLLLQQQANIKVETSGDIVSIDGPLAVAIYRILQECITNCSKYAMADTAVISLSVRDDEILLISRNALKKGRVSFASLSEKTLGLISMRERVTSLGGTFDAGPDGEHWRLSCRIPRHG